MTDQAFYPQVLPPWVRSLAAGVPEAPEGEDPLPYPPLGTVFALSAYRGWAVPPRPYELLFGRDKDNVNLPLGVTDDRISRRHGRLICHGSEWTMRNEGRLPMLFPGDAMLLRGQERLVEDAYTPVYIGNPREEVHFLEIRVIGGKRPDGEAAPEDETAVPVVHLLSRTERLVIASLAQRYLRGLAQPQPVSWKTVAGDMAGLPGPKDRDWNERTVARVVASVRERLSAPDYKHRVYGLRRSEVFGEPLGNALNDNLIRALLQSTTLTPEDLEPFDAAERSGA
ncbi:FHA domain-containing protein [Glycomyces sp. NPDC049804]|uniref:FHA domain-containing protein n=1 Tax=Glycomyces sp. NPDC049804 TaxID=3154363 RepID=UPI00343E86DB